MLYRIYRTSKRPKATACIELAVLLPLLVSMFRFPTDFARVLFYTFTIENCALRGALFVGQDFDHQNQQWIGTYQYWQGPSSPSPGIRRSVQSCP
jgi:hypothetical protein